jgi:5-methylcytosine-specific restriction endonuclease McrA
MNGLKKNERCPIHKSFYCCGRENKSSTLKRYARKPSVQRVEDEHHPRGFIEVCSRDERRRRLMKKIDEQKGICAPKEMGGCGQPFDDFRGIELDHITVRPMGCEKDSHMDNLQALCVECNRKKGSIRYGN